MKYWQITNSAGDTATILDYGARLWQWRPACFSDRRSVVLGYPHAEDYLTDNSMMGAIVGPYANRIGDSAFSIGGQRYQLVNNEGRHHLHGGPEGLDKVHWQLVEANSDSLTLVTEQQQQTPGYPGNRRYQVRYQLSAAGRLTITLEGSSDSPTVMGPTGHAYFNLVGADAGAAEHRLWINASHYTEFDGDNIPTGRILPVKGSPLDFTRQRPLTDNIDNNYVVNRQDPSVPLARLSSPGGDTELAVFSDFPGMQLYTGHYLHAPFEPRQGICLEPQFYPDSPNRADFPFALTTPESPFKRFVSYQLSHTR